MSYNNNVPQAGQTLGNTRQPINTNFSLIDSVAAVNHVSFNLTGAGKHKFIQMSESGIGFDNNSSPPSTALDELAFYAKAVSGVSQLFFRGENSGSEYQLTSAASGVDPNISTFGTNTSYVANHTGGWTFLPGGLILQYGQRLALASGNNTVTFPRSFPTSVFSIVTTMNRNASNVDVLYAHTPTVNDFQMRNTSSANTGYWYAIGK